MTTWREVLAAQDGVLSRAQALAAGLSSGSWEWRLRTGAWQSPVPGVAVAHSGGCTLRQRLWAAVLHAGAGACLSGDAALVHHGFTPQRLAVVDVVVAHERRVAPAQLRWGDTVLRVVVHRTRSPLRRWASAQGGPPSLTPHLAVLHAAAWAASDRAAEWRLAAVVQQRLSAPVLIRAALESTPHLRRRALVRAVLADVELGAHAASELAFLRFCRAHRLPLPDALQVKVRADGVRYLDARYDRQRVTVELDGRHHMQVAQWEADALRTLHLVAADRDERVVRLTAGNLRHDAATVARLLRTVLA